MSMTNPHYTIVSTSYYQGHLSTSAWGLFDTREAAADYLKREVINELTQMYGDNDDFDIPELLTDPDRVEVQHYPSEHPDQWNWCRYRDDDGLDMVWTVAELHEKDEREPIPPRGMDHRTAEALGADMSMQDWEEN